jgi:hypothetical protein
MGSSQYFISTTSNKNHEILTDSGKTTIQSPNLSSSVSEYLTLTGISMTSFRPKDTKRRAQFIFYINSILDYLRISAPPMMVAQIKMVISECVKRNRAGDSSYRPLRTSILLNLQRCMGPTHWAMANLHFKRCYHECTILGKLKRMEEMSNLSAALSPIPRQCTTSNSVPPPAPLLSQFAII